MNKGGSISKTQKDVLISALALLHKMHVVDAEEINAALKSPGYDELFSLIEAKYKGLVERGIITN